ncbi:LuxR C-terminal-related transcriptional regulator [Microbulbifer bruguierae]|uniref:LuxR C-terminal-related transcriptional regulator n=1 Tax=Microbulbifer bruguierae TaxID=3029061 RepID=A0ABY8N9M9_9GAMM|nr:LuxR C-terminal-related transcriptional regulator [Microbulbifer bruguierae]WGL15596.1 LuxR C-terminal-related transcriptional regulator [Microbulbifer bruguierae]
METGNLQPHLQRDFGSRHNAPVLLSGQNTSGIHQLVEQFTANFFSSGAGYYYLLDYARIQHPLLTSPTIEPILGLDPETVTIQSIIDRIHPDDVDFVARAEETALATLNTLVAREQLSQFKISYCARLRTSDGSYRLFNHQALIIATDEQAGVAKILGIHTDIEHLTKKNNYKLSLLNIAGGESYLNIDVFDGNLQRISAPSVFSEREMEVVRLLTDGKTSVAIAELLDISPNTVKNHRKNILKKANCKTTGQLVSKVFSEGLA